MAKKDKREGGTSNAMKEMFCPKSGTKRWHNKVTKKSGGVGSPTLWRCTCCEAVR